MGFEMTKKLNPVELDAYQIIAHAAHAGMSLNEYVKRVDDYAKKRIRMLKVEIEWLQTNESTSSS